MKTLLGCALMLGALYALLWLVKCRRFNTHIDQALAVANDLPRRPCWHQIEQMDMQQWERDAEVRWLHQQFGPPVSPGRD